MSLTNHHIFKVYIRRSVWHVYHIYFVILCEREHISPALQCVFTYNFCVFIFDFIWKCFFLFVQINLLQNLFILFFLRRKKVFAFSSKQCLYTHTHRVMTIDDHILFPYFCCCCCLIVLNDLWCAILFSLVQITFLSFGFNCCYC